MPKQSAPLILPPQVSTHLIDAVKALRLAAHLMAGSNGSSAQRNANGRQALMWERLATEIEKTVIASDV